MRMYLKWTPEELDYLTTAYYKTPIGILQSNLRNREKAAILKKAQVLGLSKATTRLSSPSRLLEQTPHAYYWLGFLLADGCFTERRITLKISNKDKDHLLSFCSFIESNNKVREKNNCCQIRVTDVATVTELRNRFGITNRKTYYPCNIYQIRNDDLLFALIVGFLDGDGCINKIHHCNSFRLSIVGHSSWLSNFEYMEDSLRRIVGSPLQRSAKIRTHRVKLPQYKEKREFKLASFYISDKPTLISIKRKADQLQLPYMARKLGKIPYL